MTGSRCGKLGGRLRSPKISYFDLHDAKALNDKFSRI